MIICTTNEFVCSLTICTTFLSRGAKITRSLTHSLYTQTHTHSQVWYGKGEEKRREVTARSLLPPSLHIMHLSLSLSLSHSLSLSLSLSLLVKAHNYINYM